MMTFGNNGEPLNMDWGDRIETLAKNRAKFTQSEWEDLFPSGRYFATFSADDIWIAMAQRIQKAEQRIAQLETLVKQLGEQNG